MRFDGGMAMAYKLRTRVQRADAGLLILILGGGALILLSLLALAIPSRWGPQLAPPTTPEGVVQRFYLAAYNGDFDRAYSYLSQDAKRRISADDLEQLGSELRGSRIQVGMPKVQGDSARVEVAITRFGPVGPFGPEEWTERRDVYLRREAGTWKITGGAFLLVPKELPVTK